MALNRHTSIGRPRRACKLCNVSKVRCSGEKPSCARCCRLLRECLWDSPRHDTQPLRKNLAEIRVKELSVSSATDQEVLTYSNLGIPEGLIVPLVDLYFSHVYNSSLLLHKPSFLEDLRLGKVNSHVLLGVCAFASRFFRDAQGSHSLEYNGFGHTWAEQAGSLVFQRAQQPNEDNVVTFINLALYWYSQGEWQKWSIFEGIGTQTARTLGLARRPVSKTTSIRGEMSRRRYWACYLLNQFSSESAYPKIPFDTVCHLSLPCNDDEYENSSSQTTLSTLKGEQPRSNSLYGELTRIMTLWTAVYLEIRNPDQDIAVRLAHLHVLDRQLQDWKSQLPTMFDISPQTIPLLAADLLPNLLLTQLVYHQCISALHASIVPLFSLSASEHISGYARQVSAQTAFEHSKSVSDMLKAALSHDWDISRAPSFIGYVAYCACAIQIPFLWCQNQVLKQNVWTNVIANLKMMSNIGTYWKYISSLNVNVRSLYDFHSRSPVHVEDEPKNINPQRLSGEWYDRRRARASILGHNEIIWREGVLLQTKEVTDLELSTDVPGRPMSNSEHQAQKPCYTSFGPSQSFNLDPFHIDLDWYDISAGADLLSVEDSPSNKTYDPFEELISGAIDFR